MTFLIAFFFVLSILSCNQSKKTKDRLISEFEKQIDEEQLNYLNEIVNDLDSYLSENYPNQELKFRAYLTDLSDLTLNEYWRIDSVKFEKYRERDLFRNFKKIFPDSVWFNGQTYCIKFPDNEITEVIIPNGNVDTIINFLQQEPRLFLTKQSIVHKALDSIEKSDSLIINYFEAKEFTDNFSPSILAKGLLFYLTDKNEYFAKRIFILEMHDI